MVHVLHARGLCPETSLHASDGEKSLSSSVTHRVMLVQEQGDLGLRCDDFPPFGSFGERVAVLTARSCWHPAWAPGAQHLHLFLLVTQHLLSSAKSTGAARSCSGLRQPCAQASQGLGSSWPEGAAPAPTHRSVLSMWPPCLGM